MARDAGGTAAAGRADRSAARHESIIHCQSPIAEC
jgi:hypothetical protein